MSDYTISSDSTIKGISIELGKGSSTIRACIQITLQDVEQVLTDALIRLYLRLPTHCQSHHINGSALQRLIRDHNCNRSLRNGNALLRGFDGHHYCRLCQLSTGLITGLFRTTFTGIVNDRLLNPRVGNSGGHSHHVVKSNNRGLTIIIHLVLYQLNDSSREQNTGLNRVNLKPLSSYVETNSTRSSAENDICHSSRFQPQARVTSEVQTSRCTQLSERIVL